MNTQAADKKPEISEIPKTVNVPLDTRNEALIEPCTDDIAKEKSRADLLIGAQLKFASESHEYVREYIRNADQKAIFYFSICSAVLVFEHTQRWSIRWIKPLSMWSISDLMSGLSMIGLAISAIFFLLTVLPRLGGTARGVIFFKSIANFESSSEYIMEILKRDETELASEKLRHCYELAKIATSKFRMLNLGLRIGAFSMVLFLSLLFILPVT